MLVRHEFHHIEQDVEILFPQHCSNCKEKWFFNFPGGFQRLLAGEVFNAIVNDFAFFPIQYQILLRILFCKFRNTNNFIGTLHPSLQPAVFPLVLFYRGFVEIVQIVYSEYEFRPRISRSEPAQLTGRMPDIKYRKQVAAMFHEPTWRTDIADFVAKHAEHFSGHKECQRISCCKCYLRKTDRPISFSFFSCFFSA